MESVALLTNTSPLIDSLSKLPNLASIPIDVRGIADFVLFGHRMRGECACDQQETNFDIWRTSPIQIIRMQTSELFF